MVAGMTRDTARKPALQTMASGKWAAKYFPVLKIAGDAALRSPVALNKAVCVIGRRLGVHLPLNSTKVSKVHALIVRQRGGVYIRDLASRNHLYVNDMPVTETELTDGDAVRVGPYTLHCASGFNTSHDEAGASPAIAPAALPAPEATLQVLGDSTRVALDGRAILIGQREDCELTLADERVAPVHAVVFEMDGKRFLRDLNSSAGAFVNNQTVHQQELAAGDEIRIGRSRIRYEVEGMATMAADPPVERAIDLSELDEEGPIPVDHAEAEEAADPVDHPLSQAVAERPEPELADRIKLDDGLPALGVIDAAVQDVTVEPICPDERASNSPDLVSIPLPTGGGLEWTQPDRPAPLHPLPGVEPGFETAADDLDLRDAAQVAHPFAGEEASEAKDPDANVPHEGEATRKLDRIVSELADKVAELETTWKEAKDA
jgi:pSer/pThr/pTyr-binding forkhead associated (FHA) protein